MKSIDLINSLISETNSVIIDVEKYILPLDDTLLKQNPAPNKWSALECIEHLNIADRHYLNEFELKIQKSNHSAPSDEFDPGLLGNYFVKMIKPKEDGSIPSPMKTFKKFNPGENLGKTSIDQFLNDQDALLKWLELSKSLDLNKIRITSAIGPIIKFKLGDAFRFLIGHNMRHIIQAKNALKQAKVQTI